MSSQSIRSLTLKPLGQGPRQLDVEPRAVVPGAGIGQVGGVHADDQLAAVADPRARCWGRSACRAVAREGGTERHAVLGIDLPELARLGELGQGPVDLDQELRIPGADRQGHVPVLAGHVLGHEPQARAGDARAGTRRRSRRRGTRRRAPRPANPSSSCFARLETEPPRGPSPRGPPCRSRSRPACRGGRPGSGRPATSRGTTSPNWAPA